jgi:hypothetical protein
VIEKFIALSKGIKLDHLLPISCFHRAEPRGEFSFILFVWRSRGSDYEKGNVNPCSAV